MSIKEQLKKISFQRLTSGGKFIPEIDGLRFIAVMSVVFYHLSNFFVKHHIPKQYNYDYKSTYLYHFLKQGHFGVELFFVISGFILAIPFIKIFSKKQGKLNLKNYFKRRLTRLEPPYFIIMIGLFFVTAFISKTLDFQTALKSLGASLLYIHNFVYGKDVLPLLNGVAWSLEIEVQFYILAPLLATVFLIENKMIRRSIIVIVTLLFAYIGIKIQLPFISLFNYLEFFGIGFLLADLYLYKDDKTYEPTWYKTILSLIIIYLIFIIEPMHDSPWQTLASDYGQLLLLFILFYGVLFRNTLPAMRWNFVTNIGGMCYTLYLLNTYLISFSGEALTSIKLTNIFWVDMLIYSGAILSIVLLFSSIFFLLIERPCMDKEWPSKLKQKLFG